MDALRRLLASLRGQPSSGPRGATGQSSGLTNRLNLTAPTVIKDRSGVVGTLSVQTAVTGTIAIYDTTTTGAAANSNSVYQSAANPAAGTVIVLNFPCRTGIVFAGSISAGIVALSYE